MIDREQLSYVMCQTSAAHTFGNVTAYVQNWLTELFPPDTFKSFHVHSKIAHRQLRATNQEFFKKRKPILALRPRIEWGDNDTFLKGTLMASRRNDIYSSYGDTNLEPFITDNKNKFAVKYQMNRHVIYFDAVLVFNTLMEQINWANYFLNSVRQEIPFFLTTYLESYIPKDLVRMMSVCSGIPIYDNNGSVKYFLDYMNGISMFPITYKLKGSTGNDEFFRYYPTNIDTIITGFSADEGDKVGVVADGYSITFTIRCEFTSTGFYYIFSPKIERPATIVVNDDDNLVPIFTDVMVHDDFELSPGWQIYNQPMCRLEDNQHDVVNLKASVSESIINAVKYHKDHGMSTDLFIDIKVRQQGKLMRKDIDYKVDYDTWDLHFYNCNTYYTYKILIMCNVNYINNLIKDIYNLE